MCLACEVDRMPSMKATSAPREWDCFIRAMASSRPSGCTESVLHTNYLGMSVSWGRGRGEGGEGTG